MWKKVENRKTDETRVEETRRKRGTEREEETNDRRGKDDSKNCERKRV